MNFDCLFPIPVWSVDLDIDNEYLLNYIYELKDSSPGRIISNIRGWQSNNHYEDDFKELSSEVIKYGNKCLDDYGIDSDQMKLKCDNFWANVNTKGSKNKIHDHPKSFVSGVYYVRVSEGSGNIVFHSHANNQFRSFIKFNGIKTTRNTPLNVNRVEYSPKTGRLILFPSYLFHHVKPNTDDEDRVSISFNTLLSKI
tara:strand:- start:92 stop:682 length:591 start_codon:yes stop_codon:yes gene_type:complete